MKKLIISLALSLSFISGSNILADNKPAQTGKAKAPDLFTVWAAKIREDNVMKALPKTELCAINSYLEGNTTKFNQYIKDLETLNKTHAQELKDLRTYVDQLNESDDDSDQVIVSTLNGIVNQRLQYKKWVCPTAK